MSKKSRKRNKKILAALALAGGAAMLAKGRGKGVVSTAGQTPPIGGTDHIAKAVAANAANAANTGSNFQTKYSKKIGDTWMTPNQIRLSNINPHEQTAAAGAAYRPHRVPPGSMRTFKKGGRVTGIAKRGFGRALMKGKK